MLRTALFSFAVFILVPMAADAALIHDVLDVDGTTIGRIELNTDEPSELADIDVAEITLAGIDFTTDDLSFVSTLGLDPATWLLTGSFRWGSPTFGTFDEGGWAFSVFWADGSMSGAMVFGSISCDAVAACAAENAAVTSALVGALDAGGLSLEPVHEASVPAPGVWLLLAPLTLGLGWLRRSR